MSYLSWISDEDLGRSVQNLMGIALRSIKDSEEKFNRNVIDPFSALFQILGFGLNHDSWLISEKTRQAQKTLQNHTGDFHQNILGSVKGWDNLSTGNEMDLVSHDQKVLAELKNKHNTVKGSDLSGLYKSMENLVMNKSSVYKGYTAYYVTIIPKKPERSVDFFTPSDKSTGSRLASNERIKVIDGASFYSLVTGEEDALQNLFEVIPKVAVEKLSIGLNANDQDSLKKYFKEAFG
ncbi:MAG: Eco47II family restriction endonuclease [Marinoscillum sp.]